MSPEQIAKCRKEAKSEWDEKGYANWVHMDGFSNFFLGYLHARTEQAELKAKLAGAEAEIAALKQGLHRVDEKLAEVMPLTYKQLRELHHLDEFGLFCSYEEFEQIARAVEQLLKD